MSGNHLSNLERHLERNHNNEYLNYLNEKTKYQELLLAKKPKINIETFFPKKHISINISSNDLMSSILELVTVNGRPLSIIEDSGFQRIINPLLSGLNLVINKENLSRTINKTAQSIRDKISREVEGKLISLKVDAVQRLDRSILGVNIQFISKSIINLRTLGIVELKERCTGEYIKENILKTLLKFKINIQQIYTITSDNGCNFLRAIKLLQPETDYDIRSESADEENMDVNVYKYDIDDIQNTFLSTIISYPIYSVRCAHTSAGTSRCYKIITYCGNLQKLGA
ncbi:unnamed protein product [Gordionus sp. m RMFG-2023]